MNTPVIVAIIAVLVVAGAFYFMNNKAAPSSAPTIDSNSVDISSQSAETSSGSFVNDTTPTTDQIVPGLS